MKRILLLIIFILHLVDSKGQSMHSNSTDKSNNVICLVPSKARFNNGWCIGWSPELSLGYGTDRLPVRINGVYTNLSPFQIVIITMIPFFLIRKEFYQDLTRKEIPIDTIQANHKLNGLAIGLFEIAENFSIQGIQFTALFHQAAKLNGLSLTTVASSYTQFNGVMISGLYNKSHFGKGVQIGLINKSHKMQGIQIGLWNIIGNKGFPIINMRFKNKKNTKHNNG